jgi:hypothetical protein
MRELRKRPATLEILRWELIERNELTDELHRSREARGWELFNLLAKDLHPPEEMDIAAMAALAISGVTYLAVRAKTADTFQGVDLHTEEGWKRFEKAVDIMVNAYFDYYEKCQV